MSVSVKYIDNTIKVKHDMRMRSELFLRLLIDEVQRQAEPITPKKKGFLRSGILKTVTGLTGTIVWKTRYAAAQEVGHAGGRVFKNYTTAGTGKGYAAKSVKMAMAKDNAVMKKAGLI